MIIVAAALLMAAACDGSGTRLPHASLSVKSGQIDFAQQFSFDWERVFVFGPYSPREAVEASLGFRWQEYDDTTIAYSDGVCLVVFVSGEAVVGWYEQSRRIDLDALQNDVGYPRDDAVFSVDGRRVLPHN